jgi:hypothetical protein
MAQARLFHATGPLDPLLGGDLCGRALVVSAGAALATHRLPASRYAGGVVNGPGSGAVFTDSEFAMCNFPFR